MSFKIARDTVSSVSLGRGDICLSASLTAPHVCHIRHALALDECRVKFIPEYFLEMNSPDLRSSAADTEQESDGVKLSNDSEKESGANQKTIDIKEVWFPGSHSDVYVYVDIILLPTLKLLAGWNASPGKVISRRKRFAYMDAS